MSDPSVSRTIDDQSLQKVYVDLVFDAILRKIKGRKLRRVIRYLRHKGFNQKGKAAASRFFSLKYRTIEIFILRFKRQAEQIAKEPEVQRLYERFFD